MRSYLVAYMSRCLVVFMAMLLSTSSVGVVACHPAASAPCAASSVVACNCATSVESFSTQTYADVYAGRLAAGGRLRWVATLLTSRRPLASCSKCILLAASWSLDV